MGKSAPAAPDPIKTAGAQTGSNIGTAIANQTLGNVNQITPNGSLTYSQTGMQKWKDPLTGKTYNLPQYTATQQLSGIGQKTNTAANKAQLNLAQTAQSQTRRLEGLLGKNFTTKGMPKAAEFEGLRRNIGAAGQGITPGAPDGGASTNSYGANDFSADRTKVEDALMQRINPSLEKDKAALEARLASQGIGIGSEAYTSAMGDYGQQANDARYGAILNAGQEQSRMVGMDRDRATFQNAAQAQGYGQGLSSAEFANNAQAQNFGQRAQNAAFYNQSAQQKFNTQQAARGNAFQEGLTLRNQPLNEIAALLSGSQVQQPNFAVNGGQQIPNIDYAGILNSNYSQQMEGYNAKQAGIGGLMGGLASIFAASDERVKTDIREVGATFDGQPIYMFRYKSGGPLQLGLIAQDVEARDPLAVAEIGGVKHVNYVRALEGARK